MRQLITRCRRLLSNRHFAAFVGLTALYAVYAIYVALNFALVSNGLDDPIYLLTGVRRTEQVAFVTSAFVFAGVALTFWYMSRRGSALDFSARPGLVRATLVLLVLLALNAVSASLNAVVADLDRQFWPPLFGWVALVLAVQVLVAFLLLKWLRPPLLQVVVLAALSTFNFFALYLSLFGRFVSLPTNLQAGIIIAILLGLTALYAAIGKRLVPVRSVNAVLVITLLAPIVSLLLPNSATPVADDRLEPFKAIEFRARPDIHIVSFDALMPEVLVERFLGITGLPYVSLLAAHEGTVFENAFATEVPTRPSLNSLMRLAHKEFADDFGYFAGRTDGPLTHILKANGYRISTGFNQQYFGRKGPFVDAYHPRPSRSIRNSSLCALATDNPYKFFNFCSAAALIDTKEPKRTWPDEVVAILNRAAGSSGPEFTLHYIFNPIGHTKLDFRSSDTEARIQYAQDYLAGAARVADILKRLQASVGQSTKPALLLIIGDHGSFLSRTIKIDDDPLFFVQDRHGILAAVLLNSTDCGQAELEHYVLNYATPERILAGAVRCLAAQPERIDAAMNFGEPFKFENFLYE